jgi:hypothetical protein
MTDLSQLKPGDEVTIHGGGASRTLTRTTVTRVTATLIVTKNPWHPERESLWMRHSGYARGSSHSTWGRERIAPTTDGDRLIMEQRDVVNLLARAADLLATADTNRYTAIRAQAQAAYTAVRALRDALRPEVPA